MKQVWHVIIEKPDGTKIREMLNFRRPDNYDLDYWEKHYSDERGIWATVVNTFTTLEED